MVIQCIAHPINIEVLKGVSRGLLLEQQIEKHIFSVIPKNKKDGIHTNIVGIHTNIV